MQLAVSLLLILDLIPLASARPVATRNDPAPVVALAPAERRPFPLMAGVLILGGEVTIVGYVVEAFTGGNRPPDMRSGRRVLDPYLPLGARSFVSDRALGHVHRAR